MPDGDSTEDHAGRRAAIAILVVILLPVWWLLVFAGGLAGLHAADKSIRWASKPFVCGRLEFDTARWRRFQRDVYMDREVSDAEREWTVRVADRLVRCGQLSGLTRSETRRMLGSPLGDDVYPDGIVVGMGHADPRSPRWTWETGDKGLIFKDPSMLFVRFDRRTDRVGCAGFVVSDLRWSGDTEYEEVDLEGPRC